MFSKNENGLFKFFISFKIEMLPHFQGGKKVMLLSSQYIANFTESQKYITSNITLDNVYMYLRVCMFLHAHVCLYLYKIVIKS